MASVGSNAIDDVVPRVAQIQNGVSPAALSAAICVASASTSIANDASWGTVRSWAVPIPAIRKPFSMLLCA